jgi:hypothetical protein
MIGKIVKTITSDDGLWRVHLIEKEHPSHFQYITERFFGPAEDDEGLWPDGCWHPNGESGLYETATAAEADARNWLRRGSSN